MPTSSRHREPYEIEFGRVVTAVTEILERDMDEVFQDLLHRAGTDRFAPERQAAQIANRIVVLCQRLRQALRRYRKHARWCEEREEYDRAEEDLPF
jgi:uncharacterized membrane protein YccC